MNRRMTIDLSTIKPTVAFPHLPENTQTVDEIAEPIAIDQVGHRFLHEWTHLRYGRLRPGS